MFLWPPGVVIEASVVNEIDMIEIGCWYGYIYHAVYNDKFNTLIYLFPFSLNVQLIYKYCITI